VGPSILSISPKQQLGKDTQDFLDKAAPKAKKEMGALELFDHSENTYVRSDAKAVRQSRAATVKGYGKLLEAHNMLTHPALIDAGMTGAPELDPKNLSRFAGMAKAVHKTQSFRPTAARDTKIRVGKVVVDVASPDFKYEGEEVVPKIKDALAKGGVTVSKGEETTTQTLSEEDRRAATRLIRGEKGRKRKTKKELAEQEAKGETRGEPYASGEGPLGSRDERQEATVPPGTNGTATSLSASKPPTDVAAIENVEQKAERHKGIKAEVDAQIMDEIKAGKAKGVEVKVSSQERQRRHQAAIDKAEATPVHPIAVAQKAPRRAALAAADERAGQAAGEAADAAAQTENNRQATRKTRIDATADLPDVPKKTSAVDRILADAEKKTRRGRRP
jgi:hypothetical protein